MAQLYVVDSPITREQRNNLNATFEDIQTRFSSLRYQISLLAGGEDLELIIQRILDAIAASEQATVDANQALANVNDALSQLNQALTDSQNATNAAIQAASAASALNDDLNALKTQLETLRDQLTDIVANETARQTNEQTRVTNETGRTNAEQQRVTNENARITAEQVRVANNEALETILDNLQSVDYDSTATYDFPTLVSDEGNTFIALQEVTGIKPTDDKVNYRLVARKGTDGTGAVSMVNNVGPDANGNVTLSVPTSQEFDSLTQQVTTYLDDYNLTAINLYISTSGNDSNDGLTVSTPIVTNAKLNELLYKYKGINAININLLSNIERINIENQCNIITIQNAVGNTYKCKISAYNCRDVRVLRVESVTNTDERLMEFYEVNKVVITDCKFQPISSGIGTGLTFSGIGNLNVARCAGNYLKLFINAVNSTGLITECSGSNNVTGYNSVNGSTLTLLNNTLTATTLEVEINGGVIRP